MCRRVYSVVRNISIPITYSSRRDAQEQERNMSIRNATVEIYQQRHYCNESNVVSISELQLYVQVKVTGAYEHAHLCASSCYKCQLSRISIHMLLLHAKNANDILFLVLKAICLYDAQVAYFQI